jgi:hypothetical protein
MNPLEAYIRAFRDIHSTGTAIPKALYYGCVGRLLNEIGKSVVEAMDA